MATSSQTTVSVSTSMHPTKLLEEMVARIHGAAQVQRENERVTLLFPPPDVPIGDSPIGTVHISAGEQTLAVDCLANNGDDLRRLEEIVTLRVTNVDAGAGHGIVWRRHD